MAFDRDTSVFVAKLAEHAQRYDDMAEEMKNVAKMVIDLTAEERSLLSTAYKLAVGSRRISWKILTSKLAKEESEITNKNRIIIEYRKKVEAEIISLCRGILPVLDRHLFSFAKPSGDPITTLFYYKMKADFSRYLAQFTTGFDREEASEDSVKAYEAARVIVRAQFRPTDPIRLGLALNHSVFYYVIRHSIDRALAIAKEAFGEAHPLLSSLNVHERFASNTIMKHIQHNYNRWKAEQSGDQTYIGGDGDVNSV